MVLQGRSPRSRAYLSSKTSARYRIRSARPCSLERVDAVLARAQERVQLEVALHCGTARCGCRRAGEVRREPELAAGTVGTGDPAGAGRSQALDATAAPPALRGGRSKIASSRRDGRQRIEVEVPALDVLVVLAAAGRQGAHRARATRKYRTRSCGTPNAAALSRQIAVGEARPSSQHAAPPPRGRTSVLPSLGRLHPRHVLHEDQPGRSSTAARDHVLEEVSSVSSVATR